jgi:hypothetical protein
VNTRAALSQELRRKSSMWISSDGGPISDSCEAAVHGTEAIEDEITFLSRNCT